MKNFLALIGIAMAVNKAFAGDCYEKIMKVNTPPPKVLNIILIDQTTPKYNDIQVGFESVIDKLVRRYGYQTVVIPFSSLTVNNPPVVVAKGYNEPKLSDEEIQKKPIQISKHMQACTHRLAQHNALELKKIVDTKLNETSSFNDYSEILFAQKKALDAYAQSAHPATRVRLVVYSDGFINGKGGLSFYAKGKPRFPTNKDIAAIEKSLPAYRPFEVIWFGLGATPMKDGKPSYLAPSDLEKMRAFWSSVLAKMGATKQQLDLVINNPNLE